jgi:hypothetical protein
VGPTLACPGAAARTIAQPMCEVVDGWFWPS